MGTILIVANQTVGGRDLEDVVRTRVDAGRNAFHLLVPVPPAPPSAVAVGLATFESAIAATVDLPDQAEVARQRLELGLEWLRRLGATADGEVGHGATVKSVEEIVERDEIDEIIVSTLPSRLSRWLRQDLPHCIERAVDIPVTVVSAVETDPPDDD